MQRALQVDQATFWDGIADKYSKQPVAHPDAFERKIAITESCIRSTDVVLDVGCGTGSLALRLAPKASCVHGLDISREMIRIAEGKAAAQAVDNVRFHCRPFDDHAPFEPESLDGICAYSLLHLVEDLPGTLRRIHRLLKPGGFFIASTSCLGESRIPWSLILGAMRLVGKAPAVVRVLTRESLVEAIAQSGFVDLQQPEVGAQRMVVFTVAKKG